MPKSKLKSVARSLLSDPEYATFKSAFKEFQSTKSVEFLCNNVVPFITTQERLEILHQLRQNMPNNLRSSFTNTCRSMLKESRQLRKRDPISTDQDGSSNQDPTQNKKSNTRGSEDRAARSEDTKRGQSRWLRVTYREKSVKLVRDSDNVKFGFAIRGGKDQAGSIFVSDVELGSLADRNGLQVGDRIIQINELDCKQVRHQEVVRVIRYDNCLYMKVLSQVIARNGPNDQKNLRRENLRKIFIQPDENGWLGCSVRGGVDYEIPVVVTAVEENSPAKNAGLKQGDVVVEVNGTSISGLTHVQVVRLIIMSGSQTVFTVMSQEWQNRQEETRTRRSQSVSSTSNSTENSLQRRHSQTGSPRGAPQTSLWVQHRDATNSQPLRDEAREVDSQTTNESVPGPVLQVQLPSYSTLPLPDGQRSASPPPPYSEDVPLSHQSLARGVAVRDEIPVPPRTNNQQLPYNPSNATNHVQLPEPVTTRQTPSVERRVGNLQGTECRQSRNRQCSQSVTFGQISSPNNGLVATTERASQATQHSPSHAPMRGGGHQSENPVPQGFRRFGIDRGDEYEDIPTTAIDIDENYDGCEGLPQIPTSNPNDIVAAHTCLDNQNEHQTDFPQDSSYLHLSPCHTPEKQQQNLEGEIEEESDNYTNDVHSVKGPTSSADVEETNIDICPLGLTNKTGLDNQPCKEHMNVHESRTKEMMHTMSGLGAVPHHESMHTSKISQEEKIFAKLKPLSRHRAMAIHDEVLDGETLLRFDHDKHGRRFCYELAFDDVEVMMLNDENTEPRSSQHLSSKNGGPDWVKAFNYALDRHDAGLYAFRDDDGSEYEWEC